MESKEESEQDTMIMTASDPHVEEVEEEEDQFMVNPANNPDKEDEDEIEAGSGHKLELTAKDHSLSLRIINRMSQVIEDALSEQEIVEACTKSFAIMVKLVNSVQSTAIVKGMKTLGLDIIKKVKEFSTTHGDAAQKLFDEIVSSLITIFSQIESEQTEEGSIKVTYYGALSLLIFAESLLFSKKSLKVTFDPELAHVLIALTHYLTDKQTTYNKSTHDVYTYLTKLPGYTSESLQNAVLGKINKPSKYTYLAYVNYDAKNAKGLAEIAAKFGDLAMNDKCLANSQNIKYFVPYLLKIDEETFKTQIFTEIEFMMKRNGSLIPLIQETIAALSFPFSPQFVQLITSFIFSDDIMVKDEFVEDTKNYFGQLAKMILNKESASSLCFDFLFKRFTLTKATSVTPVQRISIIRHLSSSLTNLRSKDLIDQEQLQQVLIAVLDHVFQQKDEATLRESYDDILNIFLLSTSFSFVNEPLKKYLNKASNIWHINLFTDLMDRSAKGLEEVIATVASQFKHMLQAENFKTTVNYSQILALVGFFCSASDYLKDSSYFTWMVQNESILAYFNTSKGFINASGYFQKNLTTHDVKNHLKMIEHLLISHYNEQSLPFGDKLLRDTLCEFILNENIVFRETLIISTLERISQKAGEHFTVLFIDSLFNKLKQITQRPPVYNREESQHKSSQSLSNKVMLVLKFSLKQKKVDLQFEDFFTLIKLICHPTVSTSNKDLSKQIKSLETIYEGGKLKTYFETYGKRIADYAIRKRTGIISPDATLRQTAINIGVALASQDLMSLYIADLAELLSYKPLEMAQKLERIFIQEFDKIHFYDLMHYAEITKDLLTAFTERDQATFRRELGVKSSVDESQEGGSASSQVEEEKTSADVDPSKLLAQMLKQQAAQKKATAATKKPVVAAKPAPVKATSTKKAQPKEEAPALDKEKRNIIDREQIIFYIQEIQRIKGVQVSAALEIVKRANQKNLFLDLTLNHLAMPIIKLLNYSATRFSTNVCLQALFYSHKNEPLFRVKNEVVSCLNAISQQRIYIKHMREFQQIFLHIENNTQVALFDKGYVQLIMMMANYVLKDLSVHLSVKEQALAVVQSILESSNLVENIDLVIVTINMMKSSYNNQNLGQYINLLLKRLTLEQLALILQRIFEYEPVPRMILLRELLEYDLPLCCPVWFSTQIWILQFDEECAKVARKIWNKYGMVLRTGAIDLSQETTTSNMFHYLRSKNTNIFDNTIRAIVSATEIFYNRYDLIVDDLIEFYDKEMSIIDQEGIKAQMQAMSQYRNIEGGRAASRTVASDERMNRIAVAEIVKRTAHLVQATSFKKLFDFFITKGCLDQNEEVSKACMDAALQVIQTKGQDYSEEILKILEKYINEQKKYSELSKNQAIIMIGALANYLDNTSQKKLVGTFEKMLELLNTPSEMIRQSICKVIPQLARFFDDKSKKFLEDHLKVLRESQDDKLIRGSAYAVAGIIKGLGMQTFLSMDILTMLNKECFTKHSDPMRKVAGLYLYETLTHSQGKVFEMNVEKILPNIMLCIADPKEQVRKAALQANRTIMSKLSNHAIKQVLPIFLKGLYNDNWRSKLASVEALGNTAFCAPRQIASFLPQIVKGIREVLSDTHEKVHEAALQAIQNIGSVIKCPEIADILETLVKALSNPNVYLKDAMKVLLDTSFVHAIDAPSLSLLIPILDSGLMMHDNESKHLASKLMGNICNLTQDPEDLLPYIKILMPAIKNSLFDSIPEIRASAAKALGSLSRGLGLYNSGEMLQWLHDVLNQKSLHSSERSGAAQGFAEIISVHGVKFFEETIQDIMVRSQDPLPHIRESYRSTMVFLATCFETFVKYLPKLLPLMIQGLSDDTEEVRKISLRNVKICIKLFGKQAPNQLVNPIMEMMFHRDFRVRQSSSVLMYQLVKELENDVIKSQPKYVTQEVKNQILSSMFILKYDIIERVATQASQIWKNIIENQLKVLKAIINVLIQQIFDIIQSDQLELQEMGLNCMRGIVEKFGEKFTAETLDILDGYMERATSLTQNIAITKAIYNMVYAAPTKLLTDLRVRFLTIVDGNIAHENEEIRKITAKIFVTVLQKTFEPNFMTQTLDKQFLKKLHHYISIDQSREAELLVLTLKEILNQQPIELKLEDKIIRLCNPIPKPSSDPYHHPVIVPTQKLTIAQARVLAAVAVKIGTNMFKKKNCGAILNKLMDELASEEIDDERRINEVLITFSEVVSQSTETEIVSVNEQVISDFHAQCKQKNRLSFYVDFIAYYCQHAKVNYEKFAKMYLENVLILMNSPDDHLIEKVIKGFSAIINGLQKENQFTMIPLIKECIENIGVTQVIVDEDHTLYKKKVATIKMLEKTEGVKNLSAVIQNSITHGSIEIRIDSAICFQYLLDFSKQDAIKSEVIKICGSLIRVVNDKFPPELKIQIFQALKLILLRVPLFAKAMAPQLQTTFLKAFNDTQATPNVRKGVVDCLINFLKIAPKVDPILKELSTMIEGDKVESNSKIEVAEILALIIRMNGKNVQPAMLTQIQTTLLNIIMPKSDKYNDKTVTNCAVALSFLAAYLPDQNYMTQIYDKFDNTLILNVSLGVKFGVILNNSLSANHAVLLPGLETHLKDSLKDQTGIEEIDGHFTEDAKESEEDDEIQYGRLHGTFEILAHIGDTFIRRFSNPKDAIYALQFRVINQTGILEKLNKEISVTSQTHNQVLQYLTTIPVKLAEGSTLLDPELQQVVAQGFEFINKYYLEFESRYDATVAVMNLLRLNYDNFLDVNDDSKVQLLTNALAKEVVNGECYKSLMPENIRMTVVDLLLN